VSALIKASRSAIFQRRHYRGDPGLFGFIGKAIGGIAKVAGSLLPGPAGMIAQGVGGLLAGNGKPKNPSVAAIPLPATIMPTLSYAGTPPLAQEPDSVVSRGGLTMQGPFGLGLQAGGSQTSYYSPAPTGGAGVACQKGYHLNKSGFYSKSRGWVPAGSVCVKNRKRNPLNPRALSRSIARLHSAKNAAAFLSRVTIREKC